MIKKIKEYFELKKAINIALKDYDKDTIIDIMKNEIGGWSNGCGILNHTSVLKVEKLIK